MGVGLDAYNIGRLALGWKTRHGFIASSACSSGTRTRDHQPAQYSRRFSSPASFPFDANPSMLDAEYMGPEPITWVPLYFWIPFA